VPVTLAEVEQLRAEGLRAGEYRAPPGGSFQCTLRPEHDLNVSRFVLPPLEGAGPPSVEMHTIEGGPGGHSPVRLEDVPMDRPPPLARLSPNRARLAAGFGHAGRCGPRQRVAAPRTSDRGGAEGASGPHPERSLPVRRGECPG
jgi:hypothetical protein